MPGSVVWGFWDLRKSIVEFLPPNGRVDIQSWARPDEFVRYGCRTLVGLRAEDVKAVSIVCLSPHVEKRFNSKKWIKVSYLNQFRKVSCFFRFLCIFHTSVYLAMLQLIVSYLSPCNLLLLFCCSNIVLMLLFCTAIKKDLVSLFRFPFLSYVQAFSCGFSPFWRLKCPYSCFSFYFCFLIIFVLLLLVLSVLFIFSIVSFPPRFFM